MREDTALLETVVSLMVLVAVATQTWILVQDATQGDAGRQVARWWQYRGRPQIVRVVAWVDARHLTERLVTDEIEPYLRESA